MRYPALFSPVRIGCVTVKNRVVAAPVDTKLGTSEGEITERHVDYMVARARGGAGALVVDNMTVEWPRGKTGPKPMRIDHDRFIAGLGDVAEEAHRFGSRVFAQINHAGRQTFQRATDGADLISASEIGWPLSDARPTAATTEQIVEVVDKFAAAAARVQRSGCDGVEIHAAHGYFLASFLSPYTNQRKDRYGGSLENRCRIVCEVIAAVRARVGARYPIVVRINGSDYLRGGTDRRGAIEIARMLEQAGADAIDVSAGFYESRSWTFPGPAADEALHAPLAAAIKDAVSVPVITVGKVRTPARAEQLLTDGVADLVALGRALIADPEWAAKALEDRAEEIRPCVYANECRNRIAMGRRMRCDVNPDVGRERDRRLQGRKEERVVVVGGGAAGMEATHRLAQRGCDVTLYERESELGGQLRFAVKPDFKGDLRRYLDFLVRQVERSRADVVAGTAATAALIAEHEPDVVVLATGARPRTLQARSSSIRVLGALDVLAGAQTDGRVAVVGGGPTGCEVAVHLAQQDASVCLIEALGDIGGAVDQDFREYLTAELEARGVEVLVNRRASAVTNAGVALASGEEHAGTVDVDTVVVAIGVEPDREAIPDEWVSQQPFRTFVIGDGRVPEGLRVCTGDAAWVAEEV